MRNWGAEDDVVIGEPEDAIVDLAAVDGLDAFNDLRSVRTQVDARMFPEESLPCAPPSTW